MNGPEHYREAENLLKKADLAPVDDDVAAWYQRQAQVHATLALAAATVDQNGVAFDYDGWSQVTA